MRVQLRFTGVGGQGVLLAGEILAEANIRNKGYGIKASTYTSQDRVGPTKVDILLDDKEILYPYAAEGEID
ncbi:MAG: 2-oxoacid:acceptor oxidoreductase family protein, partial [Helicobacter sp.]|nr:2-oxoacid:acceptor oxidoreductase family protein [Helicobacter sp.]